MSRTNATRRLAAFTALLAVLAAALLPAISHAFWPGRDATKWVEVCSASGPITIEVPAGSPGFPKAPKPSDFEHCPCCFPHATSPAILPAAVSFLAEPAASMPVPAPRPYEPRQRLAWPAAPPRAPPLAS